MKSSETLLNLGFSKYEITAYLTLVANHPVNGSQLSRMSAIPRAKIYDVLIFVDFNICSPHGSNTQSKYYPIPYKPLRKDLE